MILISSDLEILIGRLKSQNVQNLIQFSIEEVRILHGINEIWPNIL